jgi:hypothetical protein
MNCEKAHTYVSIFLLYLTTRNGGRVKYLIDLKHTIFRIPLQNIKTFRESFFNSLKQALVVFVGLLFLLGSLEFIMGIIQRRSTVILGSGDIATAFVGFALMFVAKFLESLQKKSE